MQDKSELAAGIRIHRKPSTLVMGEPPRASTLVAITPVPSSMTPRSSVGGRTTTGNSVLDQTRTPIRRPASTRSVRAARPFHWQPPLVQYVLCSMMVQSSAGGGIIMGNWAMVQGLRAPTVPLHLQSISEPIARLKPSPVENSTSAPSWTTIPSCAGAEVWKANWEAGGQATAISRTCRHPRRGYWARGATPSPLMLATTIHALFSITAT